MSGLLLYKRALILRVNPHRLILSQYANLTIYSSKISLRSILGVSGSYRLYNPSRLELPYWPSLWTHPGPYGRYPQVVAELKIYGQKTTHMFNNKMTNPIQHFPCLPGKLQR